MMRSGGLQAHSLAVLATPDSVRTFRLATAITDMVEVSDRFHLKPLLRAIAFPQPLSCSPCRRTRCASWRFLPICRRPRPGSRPAQERRRCRRSRFDQQPDARIRASPMPKVRRFCCVNMPGRSTLLARGPVRTRNAADPGCDRSAWPDLPGGQHLSRSCG